MYHRSADCQLDEPAETFLLIYLFNFITPAFFLNYKKCIYRTTDQSQEIMNGLLCYFNKVLPVILLYKKERQQYIEAVVGDVSPSATYGAEHLLRLFGMLTDT